MESARNDSLAQAREYLQRNSDLRAAIGVGRGAVLEPRWLGEGEHNLNFRFTNPENGRCYVLRVNVVKQPFHDDQVAYEFAALEQLARSGCTPEPVYLDNTESAPGEGAMVIGFCEGEQLDFDHLRPGDLRCAAQLMADIHTVPISEPCTLFKPADPLRELYDECLQRFETYKASAFEEPRITRWAETFIARAEALVNTPCPAETRNHIVNTETLASHFLIPAASAAEAARAKGDAGRFCAAPGSFIDWERPVVGDVAQDVAYFVSPTTTFWDSDFFFTQNEIEAYVEDYWRAVDGRFSRDGFDARFKAFRAMTTLRSVTWCCRALIRYRQNAGHTTEKTARKLPVYLSDEFMTMLNEAL